LARHPYKWYRDENEIATDLKFFSNATVIATTKNEVGKDPTVQIGTWAAEDEKKV
jgi:hypothetical protein